MPTPRPRTGKRMPVRTHKWKRGPDQPRVEYLLNGRWHPAANLQAARDAAAAAGFTGIRVNPL